MILEVVNQFALWLPNPDRDAMEGQRIWLRIDRHAMQWSVPFDSPIEARKQRSSKGVRMMNLSNNLGFGVAAGHLLWCRGSDVQNLDGGDDSVPGLFECIPPRLPRKGGSFSCN